MLQSSNLSNVMVSKRKLFLVSIFLLCGVLGASAQSTVHIFYIEAWVPAPIKINNQEVFEMKGTPKGKDLTARYSPCQKKCTLNSEGKVIFSFEFSRKNVANGAVYNYADEIQLTLSENSVHYILIKSKGMNDYAFNELSEKEGLKLLANKKYVSTPDYIENQ